jgi:hypothetical protein
MRLTISAALQLTVLPEACVLVGTTSMTVQDVESFNLHQCTQYKLNSNDCRHYVNAAIKEACGAQLHEARRPCANLVSTEHLQQGHSTACR